MHGDINWIIFFKAASSYHHSSSERPVEKRHGKASNIAIQGATAPLHGDINYEVEVEVPLSPGAPMRERKGGGLRHRRKVTCCLTAICTVPRKTRTKDQAPWEPKTKRKRPGPGPKSLTEERDESNEATFDEGCHARQPFTFA